MIGQERAPGLGGRYAAPRHQPRDGALGHADADFQELTMDSRGAPEGIGRGHSCDKSRDLGIDRRAASGGPTGEFGPVLTEAAPLPPQDGVGGNDHERLSPPGPDLGQRHPESRSVVRSFGWVTVCLYTASCWRKARFSRARWRWPPQRNGRSRSRWSRRVIIELRFSPDQRRQINDLPPAEILAKDTVVSNGSARLSSIIVYRPVTCLDSM